MPPYLNHLIFRLVVWAHFPDAGPFHIGQLMLSIQLIYFGLSFPGPAAFTADATFSGPIQVIFPSEDVDYISFG